ncbi:hypothetical protein ACLOJK_038676 [Asimina triloba]
MGGLGKTTLVATLYNNDIVKKHLVVRVSVYEQLFKVKSSPLPPTEENNGYQGQLRDKIAGFLRERRYLVVLDDVWKNKAWDDLVSLFPNTKHGSRVLLTIRDKSVALHSKPNELRLLTGNENCKLLSDKASMGGSSEENICEVVGREIVKKCDFLPLAIVAIGGALARKDKWKYISKGIS